METEIFFTSSESGEAWYVWAHSAAQAYFFTSMENARRFARAVASADGPVDLSSPQHCLQQAATLI